MSSPTAQPEQHKEQAVPEAYQPPMAGAYWFGIVFWALGAIACAVLAITGAPDVDNWTILSWYKAQRDIRANVPVVAVLVAMVAGCVALSAGLYITLKTLLRNAKAEGAKIEAGQRVRDTVEAYLISQLKYNVGFIIFTFILVIFADYEYGGWKNALAYLIGAITSWIAGYVGQKTVTTAGARIATIAISPTATAATHRAAFIGSYGIALIQTGNALFWLGATFLIFEDVKFLIGYVFGKAILALFDRISSHTYNVTAQAQQQASTTSVLAGTQLANGWGVASDYSETFVTSIAAAAALGFLPFNSTHGMAVPFYLGAVSIVADLAGSVFVRIVNDDANEKVVTNRAIKSYRIAATISACFAIALAALPVFMEWTTWRTYVAYVIGVTCALIVRYLSELYTSISRDFTSSVADVAEISQTRAFLRSIGNGFATSFPVVVFLFLTVVLSILCGDDGINNHVAFGQYCLAIAAIGFTSTTSLLISGHTYYATITTANALGENRITQALSQAGQVVLSTTRGVHLGAATITSWAVVHVFLVWVLNQTTQNAVRTDFTIVNGTIVAGNDYNWRNSTNDLAFYNIDQELLPGFTVNLLDKRSFVGLLLGGALPLLFLALLLHRVFRAEPDFAANKAEDEVHNNSNIQSFLNVLIPYFILHFITIFFGFVTGPIMHGSIMFGAIFSGIAFAYAFGYSGATLNAAWLSARRKTDARNAATLFSLRTVGNYLADASVVTVFLKVLTLGAVILTFSVITVCHHAPIWESHCYSPRA